MSAIHPNGQEFLKISVSPEQLPLFLETVSSTHEPTALGLVQSDCDRILTFDLENRFNELKRVYLVEAGILPPYDLEAVDETIDYRFGISTPCRLVGGSVFMATKIGKAKPRIFLPVTTEIGDVCNTKNPFSDGTAVWRTPEEAISVLDVDDESYPRHGTQRRAITRAVIHCFMESI